MTFTYDLTTDIGAVRMEIGDETYGSGVKPDGANYSNEEIQVVLTREGSVMRAVAGLCENLANRWSLVADISVGPRRESLGQVSQKWADRAAALRKQYGRSSAAAFASFSFQPSRQDGFGTAQADTEDDYDIDIDG